MGIIVVYATLMFVWRMVETRPPHWDMGRHLLMAEYYRQYFATSNLTQLLTAYAYYPPGLYWVAGAWMLIFGKSLLSAVSSNIVWLTVFSSSLYALTRHYASRRAGIYAVIFALTIPMVSSLTKDFQIDFPMTAVAAVNLCCLVRSESFRRGGWSVAYGISFGLGMLTKWGFVFVAAAPLAVVIIEVILRKDWVAIKNAIIASLICYAIAAPWYWHNMLMLRNDLIQNAGQAGVREGDPTVLSWAGVIYYPSALLRHYLHLPWLVTIFGALFSGLGYLRRIWIGERKSPVSQRLLPLISILGILVGFTALRNKDARYILPVVVGLSVYAGIWLDRQGRSGRQWLSYSLSSLMILSFVTMSFFSSGVVPQSGLFGLVKAWDSQGYITGSPSHESWCQEEAVLKARSISAKIAVTASDSIWFNAWGMSYYLARESGDLVPIEMSEAVIGRGTPPPGIVWQCTTSSQETVWVANTPSVWTNK